MHHGRGRAKSQRAKLVVSGGKVALVERVARVFDGFEDAEQADDQFYADLTPEERLDILLELVERNPT